MIALALTSLLSLVAYTVPQSQPQGHAARAGGRRARPGTPGGPDHPGALPEFRGTRFPDKRQSTLSAMPTEMRFFTPVPLEAYNMGGIYHWRVLAGQDESDQLVLAVEQTKNVNWFRDPEGVEVRQILLGHLTSLRFTYGQGDRGI